MIVFNSDLDNTLIYSYKHEIGPNKHCVEIYQEREISYMTERSLELLYQVDELVRFVPTTTRTVEQYDRIFLGNVKPEYALTCNGGVLLEHGKRNESWYQESLRSIKDCQGIMQEATHILEYDENRTFEIRFIEQLFLFTKSKEPEQTIQLLKSRLVTDHIDIFHNGVKIYVLPKVLTKGNALKRLREYWKIDSIIAAGDSEFDLSMLTEADVAYVPMSLLTLYKAIPPHFIVCSQERLFSEQLLEGICERLREKS